MFDQDLKRYDEIQRLNNSVYRKRSPDRKYGPIATAFLILLVIVVWIGIIKLAQFAFSYNVPVITTDVEAMHELGRRLK